MQAIHDWQHAFKLDPDREIDDQALECICESGTDGIIVGGTQNVTFDNTIQLLSRIRRYAVPCVLEVSNLEAIVPGFDHYLVPFVLNATDPNWIVRPHQRAVKHFGALIPWDDVSTVGYCVLNPNSAVAQVTKSETHLTVDDVIAYAKLATRLLRFSFFYVEYSGIKGDPDFVGDVSNALETEHIRVWYGGGIHTRADAQQMTNMADTIIVGNAVYEHIEGALSTVPDNEEEG